MQERFQSYSTSNIIILVAVVIIISLLCIQQYLINTNPPKEDLVESIKSLESKLDSIKHRRDSLVIITDTTRVKIIELERKHETIRDSIITQSVNADCSSFSEYLSKYNLRLPSNNNP